MKGQQQASAKTEVKPTSLRYPGEGWGIWTVLRSLLVLSSFLGIIVSPISQISAGGIVLRALILFLFLPYSNVKLKEKTGVEISRWLKLFIFIGLVGVMAQMESKEKTLDETGVLTDTPSSQNVASPKTTQAKNPEITDKTVDDLILTFVGTGTELTDLQKKEEFTKYKDKYIQGSGIVNEIQTVALSNSIVVSLANPTNEYLSGATIYFKGSEKDKLLKIRKGDEITFYGQVADYGNFMGLIIREAEVR